MIYYLLMGFNEFATKKPLLHKDHFQGISPKGLFRKVAVKTIANFLILYSIYMIGWVFFEPALAEVTYQYNNLIGKRFVVSHDQTASESASFSAGQETTEKGKLAEVLGAQTTQKLVPIDPEFSILIPKLGANARIIKNVNSAYSEDYMSALKSGVAHAAGTSFPGQGNHIYLFAHSTNTFTNVSRYNAIFYLLYKLEAGDEVDLFYQGVRHTYTVTGKSIVSPKDVHYLTRTTETEMLTMQTCWPPGTTAQRMLIFAEPSAKILGNR